MDSKNKSNGVNPINTGRNGSANRTGNNSNGRNPLIPIINQNQNSSNNGKSKSIPQKITTARFGADLNLNMRYVPIGMRVVDLKKHRYALVFEIRPRFKSTPARKTSRMFRGLSF